MKTDQRQQAFRRHSQTICAAIFRHAIPEEALQWPILEIIGGCASFGSGESTQFGSKCLVRLDGKQIKHERWMHSDPKRELLADLASLNLPGAPVFVAKVRTIDLYVVNPQAK